MKTLYIGKYFTDDPCGRFYTDGDGSGEEFREEILKPLFENLDKVIINIDNNVEGYGSSFLVEAFAGLIKYGYFQKDEILKKLEIECNTQSFFLYKKKIKEYVEKAKYNSQVYVSSKEKAIQDGVFESDIDKSFLKEFIERN